MDYKIITIRFYWTTFGSNGEVFVNLTFRSRMQQTTTSIKLIKTWGSLNILLRLNIIFENKPRDQIKTNQSKNYV